MTLCNGNHDFVRLDLSVLSATLDTLGELILFSTGFFSWAACVDKDKFFSFRKCSERSGNRGYLAERKSNITVSFPWEFCVPKGFPQTKNGKSLEAVEIKQRSS